MKILKLDCFLTKVSASRRMYITAIFNALILTLCRNKICNIHFGLVLPLLFFFFTRPGVFLFFLGFLLKICFFYSGRYLAINIVLLYFPFTNTVNSQALICAESSVASIDE